MSGFNENNITNKNKSGKGVQLEFHLKLLEGLATKPKDSDSDYQGYEEAILTAVEEVKKELAK